LSGGIAVYLAGDALFRSILGMRPVAARALAAIVAPVFGWVGLSLGAVAELGVLSVFVAVVLVAERRFGLG
jgi:hypothetical protein